MKIIYNWTAIYPFIRAYKNLADAKYQNVRFSTYSVRIRTEIDFYNVYSAHKYAISYILLLA